MSLSISLIALVISLLALYRSHQSLHAVSHHSEHISCASCGLTVARYNELGICANCEAK